MLFNSFPFLALLVVTFAAFYLPGMQRRQTGILIIASLVFYAWEAPALLLLLCGSILVNVFISRSIAFGQASRLRAMLVGGLIFNVFLIVLFKYGPLIAKGFQISRTEVGHALLLMPLPIGISFYTFESISLLVDLFRGRRNSREAFVPSNGWRHLEHTSLFVAFFPHLISGPILKADQFYPQIGPKHFKQIDWKGVFKLCVLGFFLKTVLADNLKDTTSNLIFPQFLAYSPITLLGLLVGYSFQIFADFAGYSLIAIGLAKLFGYELPSNFNFPYVSGSLGEFWRRWHISLSTWLREYLYFPLGGNRKGAFRTYLNLFLVMALGGLWHGAAWSYAVWGLYHGIGLGVERWLLDRQPDLLSRIPLSIRMLGSFGFVTLGWLFFKLNHIPDVYEYLRCLAVNWNVNVANQRAILLNIVLFSAPVVAYHVVGISPSLQKLIRRFDGVVYGILLALIVISHGLPGAFIYFQF